MLLPGLFDCWLYNTPFVADNMNVDVQRFDDHYSMEFDLPGFNKKDIRIKLKDGYLTVSATRKEDKENDYIRRERFAGSMSRSFYVGKDVRMKDIKARFENGTLLVTIPRSRQDRKDTESDLIPIE